MEVVTACTTKRAALHGIDVLFADRMRAAVFVLMTLDAQFQIRFLEITGVSIAMRIVTLRAGIFRVRIITDKLDAVGRIVTLRAQILGLGRQQVVLIRRVRIVTHLTGFFRRCAMRHKLRKLL